jgi:hypothetical protein
MSVNAADLIPLPDRNRCKCLNPASLVLKALPINCRLILVRDRSPPLRDKPTWTPEQAKSSVF